MTLDRRTALALLGAGITNFSLPMVRSATATGKIDQFPSGDTPRAKSSTPGPVSAFYVPATDGTKLALDVVLPRAAQGTKFTTVLVMTRYWRGELGRPLDTIQSFYSSHGFATVVGDVRGTGASFGQWPHHRSRAETRDFTAVMDWIVNQSWSDGRIIGMGNSYTANTADWMAERNHPALKAIVPRFADYDPYADLYFPGGVPNAFMGKTWGLHVKDLDRNISRDASGKQSPGVRPVDGPDGQALLALALAEHAPVPSVWEGLQQITYRDDRPSSWHGTSMTDFAICSHTDLVEHSGVPIQNWAGWMDAGTASGAVHRFLSLTNPLHVIIGPWSHGGDHDFDPLHPRNDDIVPTFPAQQAEDLCFIEKSLAGQPAQGREKRLSYYTCGEGRWKTTTVWPPAGTHLQDWYFGPENTLATVPAGKGANAYKVDFAVGTGRHNRWATNNDGGAVDYGNRAEIDERLLCYTSAPLGHDMEITGHPVITLFLTSTHDDGAIFAYLEAVAPDGEVAYLTEGQLRAIHRRVSSERPLYPTVGPYHSCLRKDAMPLVPGKVAELSFELHPLSMRLPAGHRLRIAIAGADADVFARIPASGDPTLHIHRGATLASKVTLPIIAGARS